MIKKFKNILEENFFMVYDGKDFKNKTGLEFIAFKGMKNPYKFQFYVDKVYCGFTIEKETNSINIITEIIDTGMYEVIKKYYDQYSIINCGIMVYFKKEQIYKFLTIDRLKNAMENNIKVLNISDIFDLDLFLAIKRTRIFDITKDDINVTNEKMKDLMQYDKKFVLHKFGKKND